MSFVTIIQKNSESPLLFHGSLVNKDEDKFEICVKTKQGTHEVWVCNYDYWRLIE